MSDSLIHNLAQRSTPGTTDRLPIAAPSYAEGAISGATQANPVVLTITGHAFQNGDQIYVTGVVGMTQLNGNTYTVANKTTNTLELAGVNGTGFSAYTSGGTAVVGRLQYARLVDAVSAIAYTQSQTDVLLGIGATNAFNNLRAEVALLARGICDGRLTTQSGVAVSSSDRTAQGTIYFTPFNGNRVGLYDGSSWDLYFFAERSLALSGLTSGKNYDVFLYNNAGTLTLELSAAWASDTARTDALTTQDGVLVKSGAPTRRWLGMLRTTSTTTTEDSQRRRFVFSHYNQVPRMCGLVYTTSHTYASLTIRQWNALATNQLEFILPEARTLLVVVQPIIGAAAGPPTGYAWAGLDSATGTNVAAYAPNTAEHSFGTPRGIVVGSMGYHFIAATQAASGTATFLGIVLETMIHM